MYLGFPKVDDTEPVAQSLSDVILGALGLLVRLVTEPCRVHAHSLRWAADLVWRHKVELIGGHPVVGTEAFVEWVTRRGIDWWYL